VRGAASSTGFGAGTGLRFRRGPAVASITSGGSGTEALVEPRRLRKVNRCLTEGRQALRRNMSAIEVGLECERLAPQLGWLVGGHDVKGLRRHLRSCLNCHARLSALRTAGRAPGRESGSNGFVEAA
jgi:hypothetical protein